MKGLFYKDYVNGRANIIIMFLTFCYVGMIFCLCYAERGKEDGLDIMSMLLCLVFVLVIMAPSLFFDLCLRDNKTKWNQYVMALPVGYKGVVREKYILDLFGHTIALVSGGILILLVNKVFGFETKVFFMLLIVMLGISMFIHGIILPFFIRGKIRVMNIIIIVLLLLLLYGGFAYLALGDISFLTEDNLMMRILLWISKNEKKIWGICYGILGIGVVTEICSYILSIKTYLKN